MHTRLFGICLAYVLVFTLLMNVSGLASFPPPAFEISINFSELVYWLPNIQTTITFSWSNIMTALVTITIIVLAALVVASIVFQSLDMKIVLQVVLGAAVSVGIATTMIATLGSYLPSWLHLFLIYLPCGLLVYSIVSIGEG